MYQTEQNTGRRSSFRGSWFKEWQGDHMKGGRYFHLSPEAIGILVRLKVWGDKSGLLVDRHGKPYSQEGLSSMTGTTRRRLAPILEELIIQGAITKVEIEYREHRRRALQITQFAYDQEERGGRKIPGNGHTVVHELSLTDDCQAGIAGKILAGINKN